MTVSDRRTGSKAINLSYITARMAQKSTESFLFEEKGRKGIYRSESTNGTDR